jgi:hypothetical protein
VALHSISNLLQRPSKVRVSLNQLAFSTERYVGRHLNKYLLAITQRERRILLKIPSCNAGISAFSFSKLVLDKRRDRVKSGILLMVEHWQSPSISAIMFE